MTQALIGLALPFRIEAGGVKRAEALDKVEADMRHLISTRIGERVMRRQYGGGVHQRLQGPNDSTIRNIVRHDLEEAIRTYMPDVILKAPIRVESQDEVMDIFIDYAVRPDDVVRRLQLALG